MFAKEYLIDLNATQAAIRAGYSKRTAKSQGQRLLTYVDVAAEIQKAKAERTERTEITADMVVRRLAEIGFGDLRRCFDSDGHLVRPQDMPDDVAALLAGIEVVTVHLGQGEVEHVAKIKTRDTVRALELLGKHTGAFERDNKQLQPIINIDREDAGA